MSQFLIYIICISRSEFLFADAIHLVFQCGCISDASKHILHVRAVFTVCYCLLTSDTSALVAWNVVSSSFYSRFILQFTESIVAVSFSQYGRSIILKEWTNTLSCVTQLYAILYIQSDMRHLFARTTSFLFLIQSK